MELKVLSLFCGCGGFDLGARGGFKSNGFLFPQLPIKIQAGYDIDKDCIKTARLNADKSEKESYIQKDVTEIVWQKETYPVDLLVAGFPCQPFSNAGNREGVDDRKGRGGLFQVVELFLKSRPLKKRPKWVILENVKGILSSKFNSKKTVPDEILFRLKKLGYNSLSPELIKCEQLGIPQQRHRVIFVACRKDLKLKFCFKRMALRVPDEMFRAQTLKHVLPGADKQTHGKDVWDLSPQALYMAQRIKRSWKDIPYDLLPIRFKKIRDQMKKYHAPNFYRRFGLDEINGTITASAQPENCGILHPQRNRRFTVREIARIQTFPDSFNFDFSRIDSAYKMVGNAIPPALAWLLTAEIVSAMGAAIKNITGLKKAAFFLEP
jgi:DNA (cytosine-5)-methyltransferase 1